MRALTPYGLGFLLFALNATAFAQPTEIDKDAARAAVQQGDERMAEKDYEGALEAYTRADDIMGVPTTSIEVGRVSLLLGRLVEAHAAFERASKYERRDDEPEPFTRARQDARKLADDVEDRIPTVTVTIERLPDGTLPSLLIDDRNIASDSVIRLNPGTHYVEAEAEGYLPISESFELVEWDNRTLAYKLRPEPDTVWPMVWIGFGFAGAGVIVGVITGAVSLSNASDAKEKCGPDPAKCNPAAEEPKTTSVTTAHVSTASFVVAGAAAIVGSIGLYLSLSAEADAEEGMDTTLVLSPEGAALRLRF